MKQYSNQELTDFVQWDVQNWGKAISFWQPYIEQVSNGKAAAFGEREGGLSLWLALNDFDVECSDYDVFKSTPLVIHEKHQVSDRISYSQQDITSISFPDNSFDFVLFKSVIGTLATKERQQQALDELHRILKPGGYLLFAENTEGTALHRYARKKFTNWGNRWRYLKWKETDEMLSSYSKIEKKSIGFFATFGRSEGQRRFLSKIDRVFAPIVPKSWRYIMIASCRK
ncbi:MAG: class I SAM-dependent methyltransferase [Crocinitomicaceae bacterium]|nr:class I SAM-dependent methyltransferase [Crocinitomicaceae bacterium]